MAGINSNDSGGRPHYFLLARVAVRKDIECLVSILLAFSVDSCRVPAVIFIPGNACIGNASDGFTSCFRRLGTESAVRMKLKPIRNRGSHSTEISVPSRGAVPDVAGW